MSKCFIELYGDEMGKKSRVRKKYLLESDVYKKTKRDGFRSECNSFCKEFFYNIRDQLLNSMKNYNKQNREKKYSRKKEEKN